MFKNLKRKLVITGLALSVAGSTVQPVCALSNAAKAAWGWGALCVAASYVARKNVDHNDALALFAIAAAIGCGCGFFDNWFETSWWQSDTEAADSRSE